MVHEHEASQKDVAPFSDLLPFPALGCTFVDQHMVRGQGRFGIGVEESSTLSLARDRVSLGSNWSIAQHADHIASSSSLCIYCRRTR